jgi:hypothetical protein
MCGFRSEAGNILAPATLFWHSEDYKSIRWNGKAYELTKRQSVIVRQLHVAHLEGSPDVRQQELMKQLDVPYSKLRDSFRQANGKLLGTMIIHKQRAPQGTLRLNL